MKKKVYGFFLIAAFAGILLLTLQSSEGTMRLSEGLRHWLEQFGIKMTSHGIRSNAHLVLYLLFGLILCLFGQECGWSWWVILLVGAGVGLIDESIKVLLPTREFDVIDLAKDWIGVGAAMAVIRIAAGNRRRT